MGVVRGAGKQANQPDEDQIQRNQDIQQARHDEESVFPPAAPPAAESGSCRNASGSFGSRNNARRAAWGSGKRELWIKKREPGGTGFPFPAMVSGLTVAAWSSGCRRPGWTGFCPGPAGPTDAAADRTAGPIAAAAGASAASAGCFASGRGWSAGAGGSTSPSGWSPRASGGWRCSTATPGGCWR